MFAKLRLKTAGVLFTALLLLFVACQQTTQQTSRQTPVPRDTKPWDSYVNECLESYFVAHPDFAVRAGRHELDGKLPNWSAAGIATEIKRLHGEKDRVLGYKNTALDERQRFERDYVAAVIDNDLFWLESAEWPVRCPQYHADAIDPDVYVTREYAPLDRRLRAYTAYAKSIPGALDQMRKNLRTPLPRTYVDIGRTTFGGLVSFYEKDVPGVFASVKDEQLQKDFHDANSAAVMAMKDMDAWLGNGDPETHIGQLLEALRRNVRFISAIEMHTGRMTVEESERMFREKGYQDAGNARQQAARGTFDPAYLNYTMGKLMIKKLREDWTATRGGRQAWQSFHDEFLKYGGPPIPLVRKAMLGGDRGTLF